MEILNKKVKSKATNKEGIITGVVKGKLLVNFESSGSVPVPLNALDMPDDLKEAVLDELGKSKVTAKKSDSSNKVSLGTKNIAIKCIYCNGGASETQIGYDGLCSEDIIKYNIEKKASECSDPENLCYKYINGLISKEEYLANDFHCYECRMFKDWKAYAGQHKTEGRHGEKMSFKNVAPRSICVLTTILPYEEQEDRIIVGLFYINETEEGDFYKEGYVKADPNYRFKFTLEEAKQLNFWDFYENPNSPETKKWGTGLHRYLSDEQAANILKAAVKVKYDEVEKKKLQELLDLFCQIKNISK